MKLILLWFVISKCIASRIQSLPSLHDKTGVCKLQFRGGGTGGGEPLSAETEHISREKWSWDDDTEKHVPIKMVLGLSVFLAKAFKPPWFRRFSASKKAVTIEVDQNSSLGLIVQLTSATTTSTKQSAGTGTAEIPELYINLIKAILGVGVLSLPAGIAAFGNAPSAVFPALLLIVLMGTVSGIGFSWIAQVCARTGALSYRNAWSCSVSPKTAWVPALFTLCNPLMACLAYSIVLTDSLKNLLGAIESRTVRLWSVTLFAVLPLCWTKDLKSLVPFSAVGVLGMVFTVGVMAIRLIIGSYKLESPLCQTIPTSLQPSFGSNGWEAVFTPSTFLFMCMLSSSFMCHINSPKFYRELKNNTIPRFNRLVALGFGSGIVIASLVAVIGFLTFGSNCSGFVLNNYAPNDIWIGFSRLAVTLSILFSYPINFQALRDGTLDALNISISERTNKTLNQATVVLLCALTLLATVLTDVSAVVAISGATLGNSLAFIFPALMFGRIEPSARIFAVIVGCLGVLFGSIGTFLAISRLKSH